eukprot:COSAG02_NODE_3567_length_6548_cov_23.648007_5_plen_425_part_00
MRFGATSTVSPFQTTGSLLIPRVRDDEIEPDRSLRLLNLDTSWLGSPEPESEHAWRSDDSKMHQKIVELEKEIAQKHEAWKHAAGLCVPVEELQPTNGDPACANRIQSEIQDRLQQIVALRRERAAFRCSVAEGWRAENTAAAQAALTQRANAWKYTINTADQRRKDAAICLAEQVRKELDIALIPWSTPEAAEQKLGTKLNNNLGKFLASLNLEAFTEVLEMHCASTVSLEMMRLADLKKVLLKAGLDGDQTLDAVWRGLHPGVSTRDDIRAAFEAGIEPDVHGVATGVLDLRGKVNSAGAARLLGTILSKLSTPLPYTKLDLSLCELSVEALHEMGAGMRQAFGASVTTETGRRLRVLDLHGAKWRAPERGYSVNGNAVQLSTRTLAIEHEEVSAGCCAALAAVLPDSLAELSLVSEQPYLA